MSTHTVSNTHTPRTLPVSQDVRTDARAAMKASAALAGAWLDFSLKPTLARFDHIQTLTADMSQRHILCARQIVQAASAAGRDLKAERAAASPTQAAV